MTHRYKRLHDNHKFGLWCNRQHSGLLIREVWVQLPSARLICARNELAARAQLSERLPYKQLAKGSIPFTPTDALELALVVERKDAAFVKQ